jgi:peptide-methionine (S)-S-oxide reductase
MIETATLAGGCFWCLEAVFKRLRGVISVVSGYSGGIGTPDYERVSTGSTGHAESIQITFDPKIISYNTLLDVFWDLHDPTTLNRQGADIGTQYRSAIFYHNDLQKKNAEDSKRKLEEKRIYTDPIVTQIAQFKDFFKAEDYHQDYYDKNVTNTYCRVVIDPKITKLHKAFSSIVKKKA